ncbi:hypothetical protein [Microbacterium sp. A84]|uniref:hypothetical protein n=1 Tax=Microbacterium sp. A84 TaxID=3450715 RepID=UPI003F41E247
MSEHGKDALEWARELHGEGGAGIAALSGYRADLARSANACQRILAEYRKVQPDDELVDLLWTAAVVNYMRPFQRDARQDLPPDFVDSLSPENQAVHADIAAVRNKHVAHSENSMETIIAICMLADPGKEPRAVKGIGAMSMRRGFGPEDAVRLLNLTAESQALLTEVTRRFTAHIREQVDARPIDELYAEQPISRQWVESGGSPATKRKKMRLDSDPIRLA